MAAHFFIRGGTRSGYIGPSLTAEQKTWNQHITHDDQILRSFIWPAHASQIEIQTQVKKMQEWYVQNASFYELQPNFQEKLLLPFFDIDRISDC